MSHNPEIDDMEFNQANMTEVNVSIDKSYKDEESHFKSKQRSTTLEIKKKMRADKSKFATIAQDPEDAYFYQEAYPPVTQFKLRKNAKSNMTLS